MSKGTVVALRGKEEVVDPLTELLRVKGQELLAAAVQAEAAVFLEQYAERRDGQGRRAVGDIVKCCVRRFDQAAIF